LNSELQPAAEGEAEEEGEYYDEEEGEAEAEGEDY